MSATASGNGNFAIAYRDGGNSSHGTFAIYGAAGAEVVAATTFNRAFTDQLAATTLNNGDFAIAYRDGGNSDYGTFTIYGNTENADRISLQKVTNNQARLWNQTSENLEMMLSVNQ